ncbi:MAG: hypothetical protein KKE16_07635 [Firmicutes bacterium]|nr:hypothetical protein [Bacillota bacterium]
MERKLMKENLDEITEEEMQNFELVNNMILTISRYDVFQSMENNNQSYGMPEVLSSKFKYLAFMDWVNYLGNLLKHVEKYYRNKFDLPELLDKHSIYEMPGEVDEKKEQINKGKSWDNFEYITVRDRIIKLRNRVNHGNLDHTQLYRAHFILLFENRDLNIFEGLVGQFTLVQNKLIKNAVNYLKE